MVELLIERIVWVAYKIYTSGISYEGNFNNKLLAKSDQEYLLYKWKKENLSELTGSCWSDEGSEVICGPVDLILEKKIVKSNRHMVKNGEIFKLIVKHLLWDDIRNCHNYDEVEYDFSELMPMGLNKMVVGQFISNIKTIPEIFVKGGPNGIVIDQDMYSEYII